MEREIDGRDVEVRRSRKVKGKGNGVGEERGWREEFRGEREEKVRKV